MTNKLKGMNSYLAFIKQTSTDLIDAALGKNNEDKIKGIGRALALYAKNKNSALDIEVEFSNLISCDTLNDLVEPSYSHAFKEAYNNPDIYSLLFGSEFGASKMNEANIIGMLDVGSSVFMNVNGVSTEFIVVHQGLPSDTYDSSCNGTWLLMKDLYEKRAWDSTNNDYENSDIHAYLNGTFLGLFDSDIQSAIKQVKIPYYKGTGQSGSVATGSNGLSAKVFLLSGQEIGLATSSARTAAGALLSEYFTFTEKTTAEDTNRISYYNGVANAWFTRCPYVTTTSDSGETIVWGSSAVGSTTNNNVTSSLGIRPALILDSATLYNPETFMIN